MHLLKLEAKNFDTFEKINWEPDRLNVIVGSSIGDQRAILKAISNVIACASGEQEAFKQFGGGVSDLFDKAQENTTNFRVKTSPVDNERDPERDSLTYEFYLAKARGSSTYVFEHELLGNFYRVETGDREEPLKLLERDPRHSVIFDEQERSLVPFKPHNDGTSLLSRVAEDDFSSNRLISSYQRGLANWAVFGDLDTGKFASVRRPAYYKSFKLLPDGSNLVGYLQTKMATDAVFKDQFNDFLGQGLGPDFKEIVFVPVSDTKVELGVWWNHAKKVALGADLSSSVLKFIYLAAILSAADDHPDVIAIDNMDVGLDHQMFAAVVRRVEEQLTHNQFFFTSPHSRLAERHEFTVSFVRFVDGVSEINKMTDAEIDDWLESISKI